MRHVRNTRFCYTCRKKPAISLSPASCCCFSLSLFLSEPQAIPPRRLKGSKPLQYLQLQRKLVYKLMEVHEDSSASLKDKKVSSICEECCLNPSKYRCPGCSIRSCSLECVKGHKQRTSCTGKRPRTQFVPLSQFNDDIIISDYNLLEEAKRAAESAQRMRDGLCNSYFKLPYKLRILKSAANQRKIRLLFLSNGMMKRQNNQSRHDKRTNSIFWTIEWKFHSTELVLTDNGVDENSSLSSVIEKHLMLGPWNNQLRPFCEEQLDSLNFFIRTNPKGTKSPFRELDIKAPVSQQLAGITILEYPVIHVFLPSACHDFEVVKYANPFTEKSENKDSANIMSPSQKGVFFKEEEVVEEEDGFSIDPKILDLIKYVNSDSDPVRNVRIPNLVKPVLKSCRVQTEDNNKASSSNAKDLRDVSSDSGLLGEADPDEVLDPEFVEEGNMNEELEEGEILPPRF